MQKINHDRASHYRLEYLYKYLLGVAVLFVSISCFSQHAKKARPWKATIFIEKAKMKGILYNVTDSGLVILDRFGRPDEILFDQINRIRLVKNHNKLGKHVIGFVAGSITGAAVVSSALSKGKEGEPRALSGVLGGIAGGFTGAIIGVAVAPGIYNLFAAKRFTVKHDPVSYTLLKEKLRPYSLRTQ